MPLEQLEPYVWQVPQVAPMRVPGIVFATPELARQAEQDRAVEQVANVATLPGIVRASFAMPDIHWGYGFPIGGVAATDVAAGGVVSPGGVGFDIACGVRLLRSNLGWTEIQPAARDLVTALGRNVPRGVGEKGRLGLSRGDLEKVLLEGVRYPLSQGIGWDEDAEHCEDGGTLDGARPQMVSDRAVARGAPQLGSLGAGNHFLEVQEVEEIYDDRAAGAMGLFEGQVCVMLHTGSRGLGHQVCTDFLKRVDRLTIELGIEVPDRQLGCVPVEHPTAEEYFGAMHAAANFARANRHVLAQAAREAFEQVLGRSDRDMGLDLVYDVSHNLARLEEHDVDGAPRTLCVHRKGATPSFGPGHPDLPERYRAIGQPVIIPGSMGTASYVLVGTAESEERAFSSTCHGAGRAMSRTQAKKVQSGPELRDELEEQGVLLAAASWKVLAEEAPYAYKDVSQVVETCQGAGLSRRVARLRPVAVVKG